jgi:hypothetical protein
MLTTRKTMPTTDDPRTDDNAADLLRLRMQERGRRQRNAKWKTVQVDPAQLEDLRIYAAVTRQPVREALSEIIRNGLVTERTPREIYESGG